MIEIEYAKRNADRNSPCCGKHHALGKQVKANRQMKKNVTADGKDSEKENQKRAMRRQAATEAVCRCRLAAVLPAESDR